MVRMAPTIRVFARWKVGSVNATVKLLISGSAAEGSGIVSESSPIRRAHTTAIGGSPTFLAGLGHTVEAEERQKSSWDPSWQIGFPR